MDKISSILPSTARISSVDVRESGPVRPGQPPMGRIEMPPEARPSRQVNERRAESGTTAQKSVAVAENLSDWKTKDAQHAALVSKLSDSFFGRPKHNVVDAEESESEPMHEALPVATMPEARASKPAGFKQDEMRALRDSQMEPSDGFGAEERDGRMEMPRLKQPEGLYPKGSFIDRSA